MTADEALEATLDEIAHKVAESLDLDRFVSVPEAARRLGVNAKTARQWIESDSFPVPVRWVGGRRKVALRLLVEFINGRPSELRLAEAS